MRFLRTAVPLVLVLLKPVAALAAQDIVSDRPVIDPAMVEALAPLLMAEDQRRFDSTLFARALQHPQALVRHTAVMSVSRIGDRRAVPLLLPLLLDRETQVVADAFFALGMLRDTLALSPIMARLTLPDTLSLDAVGEAATALVRIGGPRAATLLGDALSGRGDIPAARLLPFQQKGLLDAWHLGPLAPLPAITAMANNRDASVRYAAVYSLQRLHPASAGQLLLAASREKVAVISEAAMRALTKSFADSAGLTREAVTTELTRGFLDQRSGIRTNALLAAATWKDSTLVLKAMPLLADPVANVQVQAAMTLGALGGSAAAKALDNAYSRKGASWALRRATLLAMARVDSALFARRAGAWLKGTGTNDKSVNPQEKVVALEGWGSLKPVSMEIFQQALDDAEPVVIVAGLTNWQRVAPADPMLLAAARARLRHPNAVVRETAIGVLDTLITIDDLDGLFAAWQLGTAANSIDDRLAVIGALAALAERAPEVQARLSDPSRAAFFVRPTEMLLRREGARRWPAVLGQRWGAAYPVETGRSIEDYRGIVRTLVLTIDNPKVAIDVDGRIIEVELYGQEAPLTVANFLQLVDRRFFDGNRWHRVVPNFVVQSGDPTGTGSGGSDKPIRSEITRRRFDQSVIGMADGGLDSGTSQWFLTISPQPHLDGRYTVFGAVTNFGRIGTTLETAFSRVTQGDVIRTIRRVTN